MRIRTALAFASLVAPLALATAAFSHDGPHDGDAPAETAPSGSDDPAAAPASDDPAPITRADLVQARRRLDRAEASYTLMRNRNFPRGDARVEIEKEREDARADWERLAAQRPDIAKDLVGAGNGG